MNNVWVKVENDLPPTCTIVDGFNEIWIDEDFNPEGIRECFLADEGYWTSAEWNNDQDCWDADNKFAPTHWEQRVPPYKIEQPSQSNVSEDVLYKTLVNKITGEFIAILNNEKLSKNLFYISDTPIIQPRTATIDLMKEMFNELSFEGKELVNVIIKITE